MKANKAHFFKMLHLCLILILNSVVQGLDIGQINGRPKREATFTTYKGTAITLTNQHESIQFQNQISLFSCLQECISQYGCEGGNYYITTGNCVIMVNQTMEEVNFITGTEAGTTAFRLNMYMLTQGELI